MLLTQIYSWFFLSKWTFFLCATPGVAELFLPLEQVIQHHFLPCLVPHPPNDVERTLFALPAYLGGFGIFNPCEIAPATYQFSRQMAGPIIQCTLQQSSTLPHGILDHHFVICLNISNKHLLMLPDPPATSVHLIRSTSLTVCRRKGLPPG